MNKKFSSFIDRINSKTIKNEEELRVSFAYLFKEITNIEIRKFERKTTTGRTDLIFNNKIIEFKTPFSFKKKKNIESSIKQLKRYKTHKNNELYAFDGYKIIDLKNSKEHIVNNLTLSLFIDAINKKSIFENTIENIEENLSPILNKKLLKLMYINAKKHYLHSGLNKWRYLFEIASASDGNAYLNALKLKELKLIFDFKDKKIDFNIALFVLHTYFSIIVKNVLVRNLYLKNILKKNTKPKNIFELESGLFWRENNIYNVFEKNIFDWYIKSTDELKFHIENFIQKKLDRFRPIELNSINDDFFNDVYEIVIPHAIRKSLGEYYTPPKFAKDLLNFGEIDYSKKIMDPTCGSGTFLIQVIDEKIRKYSQDGTISVSKILSEIVGIDINPIALLAAKANILIRMAKLREENEPILIPIFNADATQLNDKIYKTIRKEFKIKSADEDYNLSIYAAEYINWENNNNGSNAVKEMLVAKSNDHFNVMAKLTRIIRGKNSKNEIKLEEDQNIYTNLIGEVDYIVGNPPWVKWSNLPESYRSTLKQRGFHKLFSPYKNSGGNSLDLYAPIIMASSNNYLKEDGSIIMIMPMSLNYNSSLETVRKFDFLKSKQKIRKIKDFSSSCKVFKGVNINFGFFVIDNKKTLEYTKVDKYFNNEKMYAHRNPFTGVLIPFKCKKDFQEVEPFLGIRNPKYKVRSGVQFSPNKLRQFNIINEKEGILTLKSAKIMKEQKSGIDNIEIKAEKESIAQILRTSNLRDINKEKKYSWWLYKPGENQPLELNKVRIKYPVLFDSLNKIASKLDKQHSSKFNERISKAPWWGNIRVGKYTQAPYRICFSDNGAFKPILITNKKIIPEGHVRFIPLYDKKDAERIFNILNRPEVKKLMQLQYLNLNKSFLPQYMYIKF